MKPVHNVIEPLFDSEEYVKYMDSNPILKRISDAKFSWAGDGVPNEAHYWGKQDFLTDPQFQGESEINYFRKTNTDLVTFLQTEGWLCLVRIRKVLGMLNNIDNYEQTIDTLSRNAGVPVDKWGSDFEKMHPQQCRCAPCSALREVKKQLVKKNISGQEVTQSVIHHVRRCVYRVLISGVDRIFETFCSRRFSVVWFIMPEEFDEHYRDTEFEKLCSLIMNDIVAIEPLTSVGSFARTLTELYEGATDLARAILHKFAVILGSRKMFYTTSMNFIMFYIDSFNMLIRILRWLESKFKVFNQLANRISDQTYPDRFDFKTLILHAMNELVYSVPDVASRKENALKVISASQKLKKSFFGPAVEVLERYLEYIDTTLNEATVVFQKAKVPCKCPTFKVPKKSVIDAALYINPYRDDQFDAPQVFHCYWQDRFIIERSQTPWKILYNNKAKILLRLSVENPSDKNKKLAINVFLAEESSSVEERIKDQYFALYESRLERLVDFFDVLKQEVIEYYANTNEAFESDIKVNSKSSMRSRGNVLSTGAMCRRLNSNANLTKISVPVKLKRPDRRSRYARDNRMAILSSLMQKHRKSKKPSTIENLEQLLTFAVKTGVEGSGMLPELSGDTKDVYVSITSVDKARRAKADQEFSLHELMSFIIFWYARHGCVTEFEGHTLHKTTFGSSKASFKDNFPLLYRAAEELDAAVGEGLLSDNDLAILEKGLSSTMTEEEIKRCKKGLETTLLMKREFNELVQSKRAFAKLSSSGFCVTLSGPGEATSVLCAETEGKRGESAQRKAKPSNKIPEFRTRLRKTYDARQTEVVTTTKSCTVNIQQAKIHLVDDTKPKTPPTPVKAQETPVKMPTDFDVDELVQIIEGTHIKTPNNSNDPNPKKAAKKARQKEKKEQERIKIAEEKAREEEEKRQEELRKIEEERRKVEQERKRKEAEEQRKKDDVVRKQRELAEQKKEEMRRKRQEIENKKAEEKKLKKEAKKQRREQRKKDMELAEDDDKRTPENESLIKTERAYEKDGSQTPTIDICEKEYGRLKVEKEQRKREEEEARRIEQLQAQERSHANKKNKKKKKKSKQNDSQNICDSATDAHPNDNQQNIKPVSSGQPLMELLTSTNKTEGVGRGADEKNNLVTIKKHMDSSVTISMKGKEGESDLVYTLMNGQVYPTSMDGRVRSEAPVPLQHTFVKPDNIRPTPVVSVPAPTYQIPAPAPNPVKHVSYQGPTVNSQYVKDNGSMAEIDLSQLKLPPGITITKVPQDIGAPRCEDVNGVHHPEYHQRPIVHGNMMPNVPANIIPNAQAHMPLNMTPNMTDYRRSASVGIVENKHNSNVMIVDSRCSSLESPVIGIRSTEMAFGANGTRPSSEASVTSDRPSSGLDSLCNNNGSSPYVSRVTGYPSTDILNKRVTVAMSSPFTAVSRNETPSPAWQNDVHQNFTAMPGMINHHNSSATERHGFWSSTPASPVAFTNANAVSESYLRAQDQQFIKPRPQQRGMYPQMAKRTSPSHGMAADCGFTRKAPLSDFKPISNITSNTSPQYNQGHIQVNGSTTPNIGPVGYKPLGDHCHPQPVDQWTPWNAERLSPDANAAFAHTELPLSMSRIFSDDATEPWDSTPLEKSARTVNPFGPIGSNLNRRPSNATSNGIHGKLAETAATDEASLWAYNRTF